MPRYAYGVCVLSVTLVATEGPQLAREGLLHGWHASTWLVAASLAAFGVACAFVFRYLDNMLYVVASVVCIFVSAAADGLLSHQPPEWVLLPAAGLVLLGVRLYYYPPAWATPTAKPEYRPVAVQAETPTRASEVRAQQTQNEPFSIDSKEEYALARESTPHRSSGEVPPSKSVPSSA